MPGITMELHNTRSNDLVFINYIAYLECLYGLFFPENYLNTLYKEDRRLFVEITGGETWNTNIDFESNSVIKTEENAFLMKTTSLDHSVLYVQEKGESYYFPVI